MAKMAKLTMPVLAFLIFIGTPDVRMTRGSHEMGVILTPSGHMESVDGLPKTPAQVALDAEQEAIKGQRGLGQEGASKPVEVAVIPGAGNAALGHSDDVAKMHAAPGSGSNGKPQEFNTMAKGHTYAEPYRAKTPDEIAPKSSHGDDKKVQYGTGLTDGADAKKAAKAEADQQAIVKALGRCQTMKPLQRKGCCGQACENLDDDALKDCENKCTGDAEAACKAKPDKERTQCCTDLCPFEGLDWLGRNAAACFAPCMMA